MKHLGLLKRSLAGALCGTVLTLSFSMAPVTAFAAGQIIDNGDYIYSVLEDGKSVEIKNYVGESLYVNIPSKTDGLAVTRIGDAAFMSNVTIKEIVIPDGITDIGSNAFSRCTSLKKVELGSGKKQIGDCAFQDCKSLSVVNIKGSLGTIGKYSFSGCTELKEIKLPDSMTAVDDFAFFGCSELKSIKIPKKLSRMGGFALEGTRWLSDRSKNEFVVVGDGILIKYNGKDKKKTLPGYISTVGEYAFYGNKSITDITLPNNIAGIKTSAFEGCTSLQQVTIPNAIRSIDDRAFYGCSSLQTAVIPSGLNKLSNAVFAKCSSLYSVDVPGNIRTIGSNAFNGCKSLRQLSLNNGLQTIGQSAFKDNTSLGKVTFPETLTKIEKNAFENCASLTRVEFNSNVSLDGDAFSRCGAVDSAVFYKDAKSIDPTSFSGSKDIVIYSSKTGYMEEFLSENKVESKYLRDLSAYKDRGILKPSDEKNRPISAGNGFMIFLIIVIDFVLVLLFSLYVLRTVSGGRHTRKKHSAGAVPHGKYAKPSGGARRTQTEKPRQTGASGTHRPAQGSAKNTPHRTGSKVPANRYKDNKKQ